ncbi:MAG: methylaspartate mutase accessory protein GlmL [Bacillota bacterium]|nr:methylaspartate mutase accessory protein GlmL [Bacillota bacterium]
MDEKIVLVDIGSTFTKATLVDLSKRNLLYHASAPTTPQDISLGLNEVLDMLKLDNNKSKILASSSAAGGLQMVAIGLVQDLTAKAAKMCALGAGARVLQTYSFKLTEEDREQLISLKPDIILLAGGTDGGNSENIIHNAKVLASLPRAIPVVIAGNRSVASEVANCFPKSFHIHVAPNVMPGIGQLQVEPAKEAIRKIFMEKIVYAKGLDKATDIIEGIFMPTPAAVLYAGRLLSEGQSKCEGWGDLLVVDVGGATTDIHSFGHGLPSRSGVVIRGLPEPYAKRTVEGDLGVRVSVTSLLEAVDVSVLAEEVGWDAEKVKRHVQNLADNPQTLPKKSDDYDLDRALGHSAIKLGVGRHVGNLSEIYTPSGLVWIQEGKDLSKVTKVIGTGGVLINARQPLSMLEGVAKQPEAPLELRPTKPRYFLDEDYLLAPMGLLAQEKPLVALEILQKSLNNYELKKEGG